MNVFSWSVPFVSERISKILIHIIKKKDELSNDEEDSKISETLTDSLKMKMTFITTLLKMYRTLRKEHELIMKLQGAEALKTALERYKEAKKIDEITERMPDDYI